MKPLIAALGIAALVTGATAVQSATTSPTLTQAERAEIQRLVPEANLGRLSDRQLRELSEIVAESDRLAQDEAREAALDVIHDERREWPWDSPTRPGAR